MNKQALKGTLDSHSKWLQSEKDGMRAHLMGADLKDTDLWGADLRGANLWGADLRGVNLSGADLRGAYLSRANLRGANLRGVNLSDADLWCANLKDADLWCANLKDAYLKGADLKGADLRGADLKGAMGIMQWQAPQGEKRTCYSVKHDNCVMHKLGCFLGDTDEAIKAIIKKYGENSLYEEFLLMQVKALEIEL